MIHCSFWNWELQAIKSSLQISALSNMILNAYFLLAVYIELSFYCPGYLFVDFFDVKVVEGVEFSGIIISILLGIEIYYTSVGNDAEFFGPFVSLEHSLGALPDQANLYSNGQL